MTYLKGTQAQTIFFNTAYKLGLKKPGLFTKLKISLLSKYKCSVVFVSSDRGIEIHKNLKSRNSTFAI
jgi:hypothetical protein